MTKFINLYKKLSLSEKWFVFILISFLMVISFAFLFAITTTKSKMHSDNFTRYCNIKNYDPKICQLSATTKDSYLDFNLLSNSQLKDIKKFLKEYDKEKEINKRENNIVLKKEIQKYEIYE